MNASTQTKDRFEAESFSLSHTSATHKISEVKAGGMSETEQKQKLSMISKTRGIQLSTLRIMYDKQKVEEPQKLETALRRSMLILWVDPVVAHPSPCLLSRLSAYSAEILPMKDVKVA